MASSDLGQIDRAELEGYILSLPEQRRAPAAGEELSTWRRKVLEELLVARAAEVEARDLGLGETEEGRALLASRRDPLLIEEVGRRMLAERVNVTEEDLQAFYDGHPEEFGHSEQIRVRNIYRRVDRDAPPEVWEATRQEVVGYLEQIRRGARFEDLARAHSDSETAPLEGLIGRLTRGNLDPKLEEILWSLDEGEVTEVLKTPNGFQLFKVEDHLGTFKMPFDEARTRLHRRLTRERTEAAEKAYLEELVAASGATLRQPALGGAPDEVVFGLGDESMTLGEFRDRLSKVSFFQARDESLLSQLEKAARERLYLWEAERGGLAEEAEIAERLRELERQTLIALALETRRRRIVEELDEDALIAFFEARKQRFQSPKLVRLRILTRDFPDDEESWYDLFEELEELAEQIRAGERDFAEAARELSTDFTAAGGGDVGAIRPDAMAEWAGPQAQHAVLALGPGEISDPVLIERFNTNRLTYDRAGYMLIKLEAIEESRARSFEEVRNQVVESYIELGDQDVNQRIREDILGSLDTRIYPENL